ncbi:hypothetical protein RHOSPDRAFT_33674 [Rhodotorula sp. JG-1b]|nr:hypothetical protein RHOSPDRAFT_33674 [Rhodotorula sp. JG-1b]
MAQTEQALLYALRSPTTPLTEKVQRASAALDAAPNSHTLPALVRDWAFDILLKATRIQSLAEALRDADLWALAARTTLATPSLNMTTPALPIFVGFISRYATQRTGVAVLRNVAQVWTRIAMVAMRKATVDAGLDSYEKLLQASVHVFGEEGSTSVEERECWAGLAVSWLGALRGVVLEAGKGGKKVPSHTLSLMPTILPLLAMLQSSSSLRNALLQTIQLALFNVDNLRRGLARETYAAGGGSGAESGVSTVDTELLAALKSLSSDVSAAAYAALPALTQIYFAALASHSTILFPLPARSTFPTPSAQKSALEVLGLTKRRELAGRWVSGVLDLLRWNEAVTGAAGGDAGAALQLEAAKSLAAVLEEVEVQDLYRSGQAVDAWAGVFDNLVRGAVERIDVASAYEVLDAHLGVVTVCARLAYSDVEAHLPRVFAKLAQTSTDAVPTPSRTVSNLLEYCINYHSRSLTLQTLLDRIADALASSTPHRVANNLLTSSDFTRALGQAIAASPSSSSAVRSTWESLVAPINDALDDSQTADAVADPQAETQSKKRKRVAMSDADQFSAASRMRILTLYVRNVPETGVAALSTIIRDFVVGCVDEHVKRFAREAAQLSVDGEGSGTPAKKAKKAGLKAQATSERGARAVEQTSPVVALGVEMLDFRYFAVERLRREDLLARQADVEAGDWWILRGKRREALRDVVKSGGGASVVVAARVLLQHAELLEHDSVAVSDAQSTIEAIVERMAKIQPGVTWDGKLRDMAANQVGLALYEALSRRWLQVVDRLSTHDQLAELSRLIVDGASSSAPSSTPHTTASISAGVLRRSDFWELAGMRAIFLATIRTAATVPSLTSANDVLRNIGQSTDAQKPSPEAISSALATLTAVAARVPREYLDSTTRVALADSALGLDLWISSERGSIDEALLNRAQVVLRELVTLLDAPSLITAEVASRLAQTSVVSARQATIRLCRAHFESALVASKNDPSGRAMLNILRRFGSPGLSELATRFAQQPETFELSTPERAVLSLLELLSKSGDLSTLTSGPAAESVDALLRSADQQVSKLTEEISTGLKQNPRGIFAFEDALLAVLKIWSAQVRLRSETSHSDLRLWVDQLLSTALVHIQSFQAEVNAAVITRVLLKLLVLRAESVSRDMTPGESGLPRAFDSVLAYHLAFQSALPRQNWSQLDEVLAAAVVSTTVSEYERALQAVDSLLGSLATSELSTAEAARLLDQLLSTMIGTSCDKLPLLLSRLNTSALLSLVALCVRPSSATVPASDSATLPPAGEIYCSFVAAIGHVVRHRKDHLVTLFPSLMAVVSAFLSILRRAGFGSLGNSTSLDDAETAVNVGQRAEREAKGSFPAWIWAGGLHAIGKTEAKALGRLLGSLGSKTTSTGGSRRKHLSTGDAASTTSLIAPLSKHAPFLLLSYLRACVHSTCPIPSALRSELQGGWFEVMDAMGKWEREALMKGLLGEEEEAERGILRSMWAAWEKERWVPGAMFAVFILYADDPAASRSAEQERQAVLAKLKNQGPAGRR